MKQLFLAYLLLVALAFSACNRANEPTSAVAAPPPTTEAPTTAVQDTSFHATGPIVVENQVDLLALRAGVVSAIQIDIGKSVHKGDLLASLDDRQIIAERDAAAAKVRSAEANSKDWQAETGVAQSDLQRAQAMRDAGINTQEELDHAQYKLLGSQFEIEKAKEDLSTAQNNLRALDLEVEKTRIVAPFDGVVARRYVRVGQSVSVGDRLFWITAVAPLQVKFTLPEHLLGAVKKGQSITVSSADASPEVNHKAKVIDVSPVVDPASGTIEVLAQVEGQAADLRPGMLANIRIDLPR
jgi:membrane fusion protein (multidrug efflux system)